MAVVVLVLVAIFAFSGSSLNQENFEKIRKGMSEEQVAELIGEPDEKEEAKQLPGFKLKGFPVKKWKWKGDGASAEIGFDSEGKVVIGLANFGTTVVFVKK